MLLIKLLKAIIQMREVKNSIMKIKQIIIIGTLFSSFLCTPRNEKTNLIENNQEFITNDIVRNNQNAKRKIIATQSSKYYVTFDLNGGLYDDKYSKLEIIADNNSLIESPNSKLCSRDNSSFNGWYTESNVKWNFETDVVTSDTTLYAQWMWNNAKRIDDFREPWNGTIGGYLKTKYYNSSKWTMISNNSTRKVNGYIPIEMQGGLTEGALFPEEDVLTAVKSSGVASTYGGCGPIAMMGIMDYYARYRGYSSIMNDPTNKKDRIQLAYDILRNTKTSEIPIGKESTQSGSNIKTSTLTLPDDYVEGFTKVMKLYGLDKQITAKNYGGLNIFDHKNLCIKHAKESIDKGIPVTMYTGGKGEKGLFSGHFVNLYEYRVFKGVDRFGKPITQTIFNARPNFGFGQTSDAFADADVLDFALSGVIIYDVKDSNQLIRAIDFSRDFVNDNGQGQYFFYNKTANITTSDGFTFGTSRLRCGYIENQYLVLSANRSGAGHAFLEMNFDINIKAMNFDISLWGDFEGLGYQDSIKLYYKDENNEWQEHMSFLPPSMSTFKDYPDNYYTVFPALTNGIKFEVIEMNPSGSRNKGRVILGDMNLFY